mmetsp:Transcript_20377/g.30895  ORF Transcript_20377/g.30895 Transcript_20377/m.30895 type:complete len:210 (-) Transcript_20377:282-911(-)
MIMCRHHVDRFQSSFRGKVIKNPEAVYGLGFWWQDLQPRGITKVVVIIVQQQRIEPKQKGTAGQKGGHRLAVFDLVMDGQNRGRKGSLGRGCHHDDFCQHGIGQSVHYHNGTLMSVPAHERPASLGGKDRSCSGRWWLTVSQWRGEKETIALRLTTGDTKEDDILPDPHRTSRKPLSGSQREPAGCGKITVSSATPNEGILFLEAKQPP